MGVVAEDEVDAEGDGDGVYVEDLVDVGFEFLLLVIFLEGVDAGNNAVVVEDFSANAIVDEDLGGDDEEFVGEAPGVYEGGASFIGIFDDVDDVAEVDDVGGMRFGVWAIMRIPAGTGEALFVHALDVAAVTAAVIEEGAGGGEESGFECRSDGF